MSLRLPKSFKALSAACALVIWLPILGIWSCACSAQTEADFKLALRSMTEIVKSGPMEQLEFQLEYNEAIRKVMPNLNLTVDKIRVDTGEWAKDARTLRQGLMTQIEIVGSGDNEFEPELQSTTTANAYQIFFFKHVHKQNPHIGGGSVGVQFPILSNMNELTKGRLYDAAEIAIRWIAFEEMFHALEEAYVRAQRKYFSPEINDWYRRHDIPIATWLDDPEVEAWRARNGSTRGEDTKLREKLSGLEFIPWHRTTSYFAELSVYLVGRAIFQDWFADPDFQALVVANHSHVRDQKSVFWKSVLESYKLTCEERLKHQAYRKKLDDQMDALMKELNLR